jgi:hypothetical protein
MGGGIHKRGSRGAWRIAESLAVTLGAYAAIGVLAFWPFYRYYDDHGVDSEAAFKVQFSLIYLGHLVATLGLSAVAARLLTGRFLPVMLLVGIALALLVLPSLAALALANDCLGVSFPWDGGCPE